MKTTTVSIHRNPAPRTPKTLALAVAAALCATSAFAAANAAAGSPAAVARVTRLQSGDAIVGALAMTQPIHVSVGLKMRDRAGLDAFIANAAASQKRGVFAPPMTSEQFLASHAPTQAQAQAVVEYLARMGFRNIQVAPNRMAVMADGTAQTARDAFMTTFAQVRTHDGRIAYANTAEAQVPAALADTVRGVLGLENVNVAHTFARRQSGSAHPLTLTYHYPDTFPAIYGVGTAAAATDIPVGIVTQGNLAQTRTDLAAFTTGRGLPAVTTQTVLTDGSCSPASSKACTSGTDEWDLDSQDIVGMSGGVSKLIFYDIPNLSNGTLYDDFVAIVAANKAKIINVSLGECETGAEGTTAGMTDDTFATGVAQGQTFSISTGDHGANECGDGGTTPSWPANSEYVVAAAGTDLNTTSGGAYSSETVWVDSGGSPSKYEPMPTWQVDFSDTIGANTYTVPGHSATHPLRDVADIAFDADPNSGAAIYIGGGLEQIGGTSLSAPLFAGTWARILHKYPTIGFAGPVIYALPDAAFHDITSGNNGGETAATNYDSASGRGSLIVGTAVADAAGLGNQPPVASFSYVKTGLAVNFTDTSTYTATDLDSGIAAHSWTFADGSTSTAANPSHVYAAAGTYVVREKVTDEVGASAIAAHTITVAPIQLIQNGGFETGTATPWIITTGDLTDNAAQAHSGNWFVAIGNGGTGAHTDNVAQTVTIPTGVTSATLSFYLNETTAETTTTAVHDKLDVKVFNSSGTLLAILATYSNLDATGGYVLENLDMSPYIGQKVKIQFYGTNNATLPTLWDVDDVTLTGS
ncbi:MAG TPA: protease pro-enzyme activation domain-containing protein [Xanthomonadaceae bacterium]|nr:protease pro-enzyme activation domain-containing protein [Xanthomonadaceae bacterium]